MATPTSNDVPVFTGVTATGNPELDPLLTPNKWGTGVGNGVSLTYSFPDASSIFAPGYGVIATSSPPTVQLDEGQQNAFRAALAEFEKVANISFSELDDNATEVGEIRIAISYFLSSEPGMVRDGETLGVAFEPSSLPAAGDIWLNPDFFEDATITGGENDGLYTTLLHEVGHALGLSHPFQIDLGVETLDPELDNILFTIMSYTLDPLGLGYVPDREPTTLMLLDIQALQYLYGPNLNYNTGDDYYDFQFGPFFETIWDAGGNDTIGALELGSPVVIDLREGAGSIIGDPITFSDTSGEEPGDPYEEARTVWIAYGTEIENAVGSSYNDVIYGNDLNNDLDGSFGNDSIEGFDGNDTLSGGFGNDTLSGGDGDDIFFTDGEGNNTLLGGDGDDIFYSAGDSDNAISGGGGVDTVEYFGPAENYFFLAAEAGAGTVVNLATEFIDTIDSAEILKFTDFEEGTEELVIIGNIPPSGEVRITGTAQIGKVLRASNTLEDLNGLGGIGYIWKVGGLVVAVETDSLLLTADMVGQTVTATAAYTDGDGYEEAVESDPTEPVDSNYSPTGSIAIVGAIGGNVVEGQTLIASIGDLFDANGLGPITYTWKVDGIAKKVGTIFTLSQDEVGKAITLNASYTDQEGTPESVDSATTNPVINTNDRPMGAVLISGSAVEGEELSVSNTITDEDGLGLISYVWRAGGTVVGSSTTYTPTQGDVGKTIRVSASYTDQQGTMEVVASDITAAVANVNDAPMGMVTITGTSAQGQELTASNNLSDADGLGPISYTWRAGGDIVGDDAPTYTPTQDDVGETITVSASYTDMQGTPESVASEATNPVANVNDAPMGTVTITGTSAQGQELTASNDLSDADGLGAISYTWRAGGDIVGDDAPTYTPTQGDVGKTIRVSASYTDQQGTMEVVASDITAAVANVNDAPMGMVTITGTSAQGQELTASNNLSDADGLGPISYTWRAGGDIVGDDAPTYTPTQDDVGETITVSASYTDMQGTPESVASEATNPVANVNDAPMGTVTITGTSAQGQELTASNDLSDADGLGAISYTWRAGGDIVGDDAPTYTPTQDDVGETVTITVSYTDQQGTPESIASESTDPVANVNDAPLGAVTISGTAEEGQELTASNDLSDADGLGSISYSWRASGEDVGSGPAFTPGQSEVGKTITVTASYTDLQDTEESVESEATDAVTNANDAPMGAVTISGTAEEGQELTASNDLSDADGLGTISYSWRANGEDVGSGPAFTPGQSEVGKTLTVTASYTDLQGTEESVQSDGTDAVANVNDMPTGTVTISGSVEQGQVLTASNDLADPEGLGSISYSWKAGSDTVGGGATYTPNQNDVGKTLTVTASYTDQQGTAEAVTSDATTAVANVNDHPMGEVTIGGTPEQGQELSATNLLSDLDGLGTVSYSWKADGDPVGSGPTFTPGQNEVGKTITVTASYTDLQGTEESVESDATEAVANVNDDPTGAVTISGIAEQGQELSAANTLDDLDGLGTVSYSWKADGDPVGSGPAFTPGQNEVGKTITVTASYTDLQGTEESVESEATDAIANVNDDPTGSVTISGIAEQGQELSAANTLDDLDGLGTVSYSWKADGEPVGSGPAFTPGQSEVGKTITVTASYTDLHGTEESVESNATGAVANVNDDPTGSVTISGIAEQGQELSAANTLDDLDGLGTVSYSWKADGDPVGSGPAFTPGQSEVGKTITVTASYTDQQGTGESVESAATNTVANVNDAPVGAVTISGAAEEGQELAASNDLSDADGLGAISYSWRADGEVVGSGDTFTPGQGEVGKVIAVTASYTDLQGTEESVESDATDAVANVNDEPTGDVVISGTAEQGQLLTATNTLQDPDGLGEISYRWNSGGTDRGAGMTLLLTQADVGNTITVTASYTDDGGALESVSSEAAGPVENVNDAPVGLVQIAGEAFVGETLSASNTLSDADGLGDISYTWKADDTTVGVGDSYLLTASDVSRSLTVEAAYTDGGGFAELVSSQGTAPVETTEAEPLVNIESFIALRDFIVSAFQIREVIGVLPGTAAGEGLIQMFSIQDGTVSAGGESKVGRFGEFRLDPDTGAYRYIPNRQAIEAADETASEVFVVSVSDGSSTEYRIINVANFDGNEFVIIDPNDDGRLFDAELILESGGTVIAEEVQLFRTYAGAMGRDPDDGGFGWWSDQIAQGNHDLRSMIEGFLWSAEFLGFFDATRPDEISSGDFVLHMYTAGFGRDPDEEGFAFWKGELDSGNRTQVQVILDMTQSNEFVGVTSLAAVDLLFG